VANNLLTMSYITNESLVVLENELVIANRVERQYSKEFAQTGAKIGNTCNVRRPPRYKGTYGPPLNVEDTNETYIPVALNYQFHVDIQFTAQDLALSMDMFKKRVLKPQIATVANRIDSDTAQYAYLNTAAMLGTFGVSPNSLKIFTDARAYLANEACPREGEKNAVLDPTSMSSMVATVQGLFNPQAKIGEFIEAGMVAREFAGLDWWEDQNIPVFTTGAAAGSPVLTTPVAGTAFLTTGWAQSGTVSTQGWTASTAVVNVGDIIQFAGVYPVNPQNRNQYGKTLRQFVVLPPGGFAVPPNGAAGTVLTYGAASLAAGTFNPTNGQYTASGTGTLTLTIGDCCISGGQFQNVTAAPASGAQIFVNNNTTQAVFPYASTVSPQSLVFHKYAYALAFADLPLPRGVEFAARAYDDEDVGMSIRVVSQYTINNDSEPTRADVLYGAASLYRTLGLRIAG
jgi:P22 coat protein - gene protein 5